MLPIDLRTLNPGDKVSGLILIQSYEKQLNTESKAPLYGFCTYQGKSMKFKIWKGQTQDAFNANDYTGQIALINGDVSMYQGNPEITLQTAIFTHGVTDKALFYKSADIETIFTEFSQFIAKALSPKALNFMNELFRDPNFLDQYKKTWAGEKMHDAQVGGLLNHTFKMLKITRTLIANDARLAPYSDILYLGIIVHDIGKIQEIGVDGTYKSNGFIGHRTIGIEILHQHKAYLVENFSEDFYYHLQAIVQGHHGAEFGDAPTTVWAQVVAYIDMLESQTTGFLDRINNEEFKERAGHKTIWIRDRINLPF